MGSTSSTTSLQDYKVHKSCDNHSIVTKKSQSHAAQSFFLKTFSTSEKELHQSQLSYFKEYYQQMKDNQELTGLIEVFEERTETFCSSCYKIHLLFEYSPITVYSEILERRRPQHTLGRSVNPSQKSQFFKYEDLCNILYSCLSALWQIKEQSSTSPNAELQRFQTIFITTKDILILQDGAIKITDPYLYNYEHRYSLNSNHCYSPQKISDFSLADDEKCSIYELGVTMLQIALLTDLKNTTEGAYDENKVRQKIEVGRQLYQNEIQDFIGVTFFDIVEKMVETDREKRYSLAKVIEYAEEMYEQQGYETGQISVQEQPHPTTKKAENNLTTHTSNSHSRSPSLNKFRDYNEEHKITTMSPKISNFIIEEVQPQKQEQSSMLESLNVQNPPSKIHHFASSITAQGIFRNVSLNDSYSYQIGKPNICSNNRLQNKQNESQQLFTDPELLKTIRRELEQIERRKDEKGKKSYRMDSSLVVERKVRHDILAYEQKEHITNGVYLTQ